MGLRLLTKIILHITFVLLKEEFGRKLSEGIKIGCTAKGRKERTGARVLKVMVPISYEKGVIMCEPYEKIPGSYSENFIDRNFNRMFELADKGPGRIFFQDGDPCQNSAAKESHESHSG